MSRLAISKDQHWVRNRNDDEKQDGKSVIDGGISDIDDFHTGQRGFKMARITLDFGELQAQEATKCRFSHQQPGKG